MDPNKVESRRIGFLWSRTIRRVRGHGDVSYSHRIRVRHEMTCAFSQYSDYTLYQSMTHVTNLDKKKHNMTETYMYIYQT